MRWQDLFADLEGQAAAWEQADLDAEIADRARAEQGTVALTDRLSAAVGAPVALRVAGVAEARGRLLAVGADWLLLADDGVERLVMIQAVLGVLDLGRRADSAHARGTVMPRLGVAAPMRAIVRDRAVVRVCLRDGSDYVGTPERVGADHLDLLLHEADAVPRAAQTWGRVTVPFGAVALVRKASSGWG